jgi:hypothetical protein
MRTFRIIITVILVFGLANSSRSHFSIFNMKNQIKENKLEKSRRIKKVSEYRYNDKLKWYPSKLTLFYYENESFLEGTITYSDYSVESKKYATRIENRNGRDLDSPTKITPLKDINIENWTKEKGTIWLNNKKEDTIEKYQFRFLSKSNEWYLYNLMTDTFENNRKIQRYFFSDIDPGNYPIQESKELFTYNDTLLTESLSMSRKGKDSEWIPSRKENFEYQNGVMVKRELFFYFEDENKWNLSESEEFISEEQTYTKIFFEYDNLNKTKSGYKIIEKRNASEILEEKIHLNWNDRKKSYEHFYTENNSLKGDLSLQVIQSYTQSGYYDKYATFNKFDSLNRLVKSEKKNKNDEDKDWKYLSGVSLFYDQENVLPSSIQKTNAKGEMNEETKIILDNLNNPINRIYIKNGRKNEVEIKHDYSIDSDNIVNSGELKLLETNIEKNIWRHNKAPIERTYYRINNGEKVKYKKIEYTFEEIK